MAKIYKEEKQVKEVVIKTLIYVKCDWCGKEIPSERECDDNKPRIETDIKQKVSFPCYESGRSQSWRIDDLCLLCGEKLKNHLKGIGIMITEDSFDW